VTVRAGAILVTGAAGFVGHAVRLRLEAVGRRVLATDLRAGSVEGRSILAADVTDPHTLYAIARQERITGIVHCGALSGPMLAADDPARIVAVNLGGTATLLEVARRIGGVRFVFASSTAAVGPTPPHLSPVPAAIALNPSTVYGATKAAGEALVAGYARQHAVDGVSLRLAWVYGPRRATACSIRRMLTDALSGRTTALAAMPGVRRQYVHLEDAAEALVRALDTPRLPQPAYAITGGTSLALSNLAELVRAVVSTAHVTFGTGDPDDEPQGLFDISDSHRDFGYAPKVSIEEGIPHYVHWLRNADVGEEGT
jgi:nucleoside-diphosphate-sugar epimerase